MLREAYELKKSLSEVQLVDRTSIVVSEKNNVLIEQMYLYLYLYLYLQGEREEQRAHRADGADQVDEGQRCQEEVGGGTEKEGRHGGGGTQ